PRLLFFYPLCATPPVLSFPTRRSSDLFIGLGIMGAPMAGHLIKGAHEVFLNTRRKVPGDLVAAGGVACASAAEVARRADVIITIDRKSTRLNSSHQIISYAVFCLKKKK